MDDKSAQDIRRYRHGDRAIEDAAEAAAADDRGVLTGFCGFEPGGRGDRDRRRCHDPGPRSGLDLLHFHGSRLWSFHLCCRPPSHLQGLQTTEREPVRHAFLEISGGSCWRRSYRCRHDLGLMILIKFASSV